MFSTESVQGSHQIAQYMHGRASHRCEWKVFKSRWHYILAIGVLFDLIFELACTFFNCLECYVKKIIYIFLNCVHAVCINWGIPCTRGCWMQQKSWVIFNSDYAFGTEVVQCLRGKKRRVIDVNVDWLWYNCFIFVS